MIKSEEKVRGGIEHPKSISKLFGIKQHNLNTKIQLKVFYNVSKAPKYEKQKQIGISAFSTRKLTSGVRASKAPKSEKTK